MNCSEIDQFLSRLNQCQAVFVLILTCMESGDVPTTALAGACNLLYTVCRDFEQAVKERNNGQDS